MKVNFGFFLNKIIKYINRAALRDCKIDRTSKIGSGSNCIQMEMGKYSYMGEKNSVFNTKIGSFCSIASYCSIGGGTHPFNLISTSPVFYGGRNIFRKNFSKDNSIDHKKVIIGNDVWIGESVFIKEGIIIGDGAIIGAHSVVTHNVPPYSIMAGVPARIIRKRFEKKVCEVMLNSEWWNWSDEELSKIKSYEISSFIDELERDIL